jgi:hypothetical protein
MVWVALAAALVASACASDAIETSDGDAPEASSSTAAESDASEVERLSTGRQLWPIVSWPNATEEERLVLERGVANVTFWSDDSQALFIVDVPCARTVWNIIWSVDGFNVGDVVPRDPEADSGDPGLCEETIESLEQLRVQRGQTIVAESPSGSGGEQTLSLRATDGSWFLELLRPASETGGAVDRTEPETTTTTRAPSD